MHKFCACFDAAQENKDVYKQAQNLCISAIALKKFEFSKFEYCGSIVHIIDKYRENKFVKY